MSVAKEILPTSSMTNTRIFVVKVVSRCNLNCSYCYMYNHPDQSWKNQPKFMERETVKRVAERLKEHASNVNGNIMVVAHGGEPLMYPELDFFFDEIKSTVKQVVFAIQTNGTLFSKRNVEILTKHDVRIGVSIDGDKATHDKYRVSHSGKGSYDRVLSGLSFAKKNCPDILDSVLQVIDPKTTPIKMLDTLESYGLERADFLFPDLNNDTIFKGDTRPGDYGNWLVSVFDEWIKREDTVHIRIFLTIIDLILGGRFGTDQLGTHSIGTLMIETDGSYEIHDGLKTSFDGAGKTGMSVYDTKIKTVEEIDLAVSFRNKAFGASKECLDCRLFNICGGGSPLHRYSETKKFNQPSVFCKDLTILIDHISEYMFSVRPDLVN